MTKPSITECPICKVPLMIIPAYYRLYRSHYLGVDFSNPELACPMCGRSKKLIKYILDKYNEYTLTKKIYGKLVYIDMDIDESFNVKSFLLELEKCDEFEEYKSELEMAVFEMAPHKVANYLYELAQDF